MTLTQTSKTYSHSPRPKRFEAYISNRTQQSENHQNTKINMYFYKISTKINKLAQFVQKHRFPIILDFCATFSQNPQNPTVFSETFYIY